MRKTVSRSVVAGLLSAPLLFGATGVAQADDFERTNEQAGPQGVVSQQESTRSGGDSGGGNGFESSKSTVGPDGVETNRTNSNSGGDEGGLLSGDLLGGILGGGDDSASFEKKNTQVGPDGASSETTKSNSGSNGDGTLSGIL